MDLDGLSNIKKVIKLFFSLNFKMKSIKTLRARALDLLARRETSRAELKRKLSPHAASEDEIESLLDELAERSWQSDRRFAEAFVHSKSGRYGARRLAQALAEKGVGAETVREFLPGRESEAETARRVLRKKFKQPAAGPAEKQKQMRFLAYRGFDADIIGEAIESAWKDEA